MRIPSGCVPPGSLTFFLKGIYLKYLFCCLRNFCFSQRCVYVCFSRSVCYLLICLKPKRYNIGQFAPSLLGTQAGQPGCGQTALCTCASLL